MTSVEELYELWSHDSELRETLKQSLEPRGTEWLFELFASLEPHAGDVLLDVGCRDAKHAIRLVREHELRGYALDPLPLHVERAKAEVDDAGVDVTVLEGTIEALPFDDDSVDWIWCRDVLVHTDVRRGLAECARVLRPRGRMLTYVTLATDRLEPREKRLLVNATALVPESLDRAQVEAAARAAGLSEVAVHRLAGEWRERMIEDDSWNAAESLLALSRLQRHEAELVAEYGATAVDAVRGGQLWGIYQMIGKLCPTVYVWERNA
jgi:ubiquinone/menaquinone biosynthesis C-methylase UbiE